MKLALFVAFMVVVIVAYTYGMMHSEDIYQFITQWLR
jgi:hypothetical protein